MKKKKLQDGDYKLAGKGVWIDIKGFAIRVHETDDGVAVDIYESGKEDEFAISSAYAFFNEIEEQAV